MLPGTSSGKTGLEVSQWRSGKVRLLRIVQTPMCWLLLDTRVWRQFLDDKDIDVTLWCENNVWFQYSLVFLSSVYSLQSISPSYKNLGNIHAYYIVKAIITYCMRSAFVKLEYLFLPETNENVLSGFVLCGPQSKEMSPDSPWPPPPAHPGGWGVGESWVCPGASYH